MSKLVKLSTTLDTNRDTNGYVCISDNDIILEPNAKVSLLNAHLSSGIITDYKIQGTDSYYVLDAQNKQQVASGKEVLALNLSDSVGDRPVIIPNGNYDISGMLTNIQNGLNSAAVYNSDPKFVDATALHVPTDQAFGLGHAVGLDADKVKIAYNSIPQKYQIDLTYSVKDPSITVAADGTVSYTGLPPADSLQLIEARATARQVISAGPATNFNVNDSCLLISVDQTQTLACKITEIVNADDNLADAFAVAPYPNATAPILQLKSTASYSGNALNPDDYITCDDGTGVFGTPSALQVIAQVDTVATPYTNPVIEITLLDEGKLDETQKLEAKVTSKAPKLVNGQPVSNKYNNIDSQVFTVGFSGLTINSEAADMDSLDFKDGNYVFIYDDKGTLTYLAIISNRTIVAGSGVATMDIDCIPLNPLDQLDVTLIDTVTSAQSWFSDTLTVADTIFQTDMQVGFADDSGNFYGRTQIDTLVNSTANQLIYTLKPVFETDDKTDFEAFIEIWQTFLDGTRTLANLELKAINWYQTDVATTLAQFNANFNQGDTIVIDAPGQPSNTIDDTVEVDIGTDKFVIFSLGTPFTTLDELNNYFDSNILDPPVEMAKDSFDKDILITLKNLSQPIDPAINRLWEGQGIVFTQRISLTGFPGQTDLTRYNTLVKGTNRLPKALAYAIEDNILSHSCGRAAWYIKKAGLGEMGIMPDGTVVGSNLINCPIRIQMVADGNLFKYKILFNNIEWNARAGNRGVLNANDGDYVVLQWGVTPSTDDFEYVNKPVSVADADTNFAANNIVSTGDNHNLDKNKCLLSVIRAGGVGTTITNKWIYMGCPLDKAVTAPNTFPGPGNVNLPKARVIPWTPRNNPYLDPIIWDVAGNYHVYVSPYNSEISTVELTPTAKFTTLTDGSIIPLVGTGFIYHADMHDTTNLDADYSQTKFNALTNSYKLSFTDAEVQKLLGYKLSTITLTGLTNSWTANLDYLRAYLPEGIVILLESLNCDTYDLGQFNGSRRNIIATAIDTQSKAGEVSIEPSNLYRVGLGNKQPINLRKFALAFEDLNGNRLLLANAKVTVCLLFE